MGSSTKFNLLLITIVSLFLMSFSSESIKTATLPGEPYFLPNNLSSPYYTSSVANHFNTFVNPLFSEQIASVKSRIDLQSKSVKYKTKCKRAVPSSAGLKQPVKVIDPSWLYLRSKETYSKPHFLSHLHRFLFRLTPF